MEKFRQGGFNTLKGLVLLCMAAVLFCPVAYGKDDDMQESKPVIRNRVFRLRYADPKKVMEIIEQYDMAKAVNMLPNESLIVTASDSSSLQRVTGLVELLDRKRDFVIETLVPKPEPDFLPSPEKLDMQIRNVTIGTFSNPPESSGPMAIVDILNGSLMVICEKGDYEEIKKGVEELISEAKKKLEVSGPPKPEEKAAAQKEQDQPAVENGQQETDTEETAQLEKVAMPPEQAQDKKPAPDEDTPETARPQPEKEKEVTLEDVKKQLNGSGDKKTSTTGRETPSDEEDFFGEELLKALEKEEQKAAEETEAEKQPEPAALTEKTMPEKETATAPEEIEKSFAEETPAQNIDTSETMDKAPAAENGGRKFETYLLKKVKPGKTARVIEAVLKSQVDEKASVVPDDENGHIVIYTTPEAHKIAQQLILSLDNPVELTPEPEPQPEAPAAPEPPDTPAMQDRPKPAQPAMEVKPDQLETQTTEAEPQMPTEEKDQTKQALDNMLNELIKSKQEKEQPEVNQPGPDKQVQSAAEGLKSEAAEEAPEIETITPREHIERVTIPEAEKELETRITLPENIQITDLLKLVGEQLGLNYIYDPAQVSGQVTLYINDGKIKVGELYALVESVLQFRGFVMSKRGKLVTIVKKEQAMTIDPAFRSSTDEIEPGDVVVTSTFQLDHISTESAHNLLKNMNLGIHVNPIPETGSLIVTEYAFRLDRIEELLELVDVPGDDKRFEFRQLQYTLASNLASKVQTLAERLEGVSVEITQTAPTPQQPASRTSRSRTTRRPTPTPAKPGEQAQDDTIYLDTDDRTNRILMIGRDSDIQIVNELIDALDVKQQDLRTIQQYEIQYVGAEEVYDKLVELEMISATSRTGTSRTSRTTSSRTSRTTSSRTPTPQTALESEEAVEELLEGQPQVVVLESTNSLLVNATPEQHVQIATIISYVDAELEDTANPYVVYALENQDPEELAEVLQKVVEAQLEGKGKTSASKDPKVQSTAKEEENVYSIVPDKNTFSIIVYANKKLQEQIGKLIEVLDKRRPQVLIDVALVEITRNDAFEYDLQLVTNLANRSVSENILPFPVGESQVTLLNTNASQGKTYLEGGWNVGGSGESRGFYGDDNIQALLTLVQSKGYGRVLAQPKLLANDNETGTIETTTTTYVRETTTTVVTDGQSQESEKFNPYDATIKLEITPTISEGDLLRLEITMGRQDFTDTFAGDRPPDTRSTDVTTVVTVPDGDTIILGGLTKLNQSKGGSKVPILGDIPLVGSAFRSVNNSIADSYLYLFVKSKILRPDSITQGFGQLNKISEGYREIFEEQEKKFQELEEFPGVEPEPVEPINVLQDIQETNY